MLKQCIICDKIFEAKRKEQKTCSVKCGHISKGLSDRGKKKEKFLYIGKTCPICNKSFIPYRKGIETCSVECGHKLQGLKISGENNGLYNKNLPTHICKQCGKEFRLTTSQMKRGDGKFCSTICHNKSMIVDNVEFKCKECGKKFYRKPHKAKVLANLYCSRKCYIKNYNKRSYKVDYMVDLLKNMGYVVEEEHTFDWLKNPATKHNLFIDLFLPDHSIAIEYDGRHHFEPSLGYDTWEDVYERQKLDKIKDTLCKVNGISMIRFKYNEDLSQKYILHRLEQMI